MRNCSKQYKKKLTIYFKQKREADLKNLGHVIVNSLRSSLAPILSKNK